MINFLLFLLFATFILTYIFLPYVCDKLLENRHVVVDKYKKGKPKIPTHGAFIVIFSAIIVSGLVPLFSRFLYKVGVANEVYDLSSIDISILLVICLFLLFGIIDDLLNLEYWSIKLILPLFFIFPMVNIVNYDNISLPFFGNLQLTDYKFNNFDASDFVKFVIVPIYLMVVVNLINMHSGFNGLQSGLSVILLSSIIVKCIIEGNEDNLLVPASVLGGLIAFFLFNKYPARIIEGNSGSLAFGSTIGILLLINKLFIFGIVILLPHIFDFLLFIYVILSGKEFVKYGEINEQGHIIAPNPFKMKFLFPSYFELTEEETVRFLFLLTSVFCIFGILFT